mmetsp:Transcript_51408/g.132681  ORF Transcript_51408/g.132681 Transcript_51408/m.132681 type:complete len:262 (-) Transcript_51408:495-1280(-)
MIIRSVQCEVVRSWHVFGQQLGTMGALGQRALLISEGRRQRRAVRERRSDRPTSLVSTKKGPEEGHLSEAQVTRQPRQTKAQGRGHIPSIVLYAPLGRIRRPLAFLDCARSLQRRHGLVDARLRRRIQRLRKASRLQARTQHLQHELHQGATQNLRCGHLLKPPIESRRREQVESETFAHTARATAPLQYFCSRDELLLQGGGVGGLLVALALHLARVDHEDTVGDGDAGLSNVCAQDDLPDTSTRALEGLRLVVAGEDRV